MSRKAVEYTVLVAFLALCLGGGYLSGQLVAPNIPTWYAGLEKPPFNPPNWLFAPVWTLLYAMMAVAGWRIWCRRGWLNGAMIWWWAQLGLNFLWSWLFFGRHDPMLAFIDILWLGVALAWTVKLFWRIDRAAAWLLIPYLAWVSFAGLLNYEIWRLNG